ncbi:fatty-acyl-CoA synthase [Caldanaerobius fijiensis DSM 17918]|uniref:Fatty-acyl-CoA synthase n=1 Tax=Caldanaerobius fijiensis DSM 17918 TaxID=1121256 RepID=A0A1M4V0L1_9THEO|nr:AMP-binding protein [Caldanaerobius fijiensis]SHE62427.1 fatty-acyl-CoA synthase [Caldanaerobius fijiensis DSM 17918]
MIDMTIGQYLDYIASKYPDQDALIFEDKVRYSYRILKEISNRLAKGLLKIGIKKGDHVAIWATNIPEWVVTLFATAKIGAPLVSINTAYKEHEVEYILRQSDARALVLIDGFKDSDYIKTLYNLVPELKHSSKGILRSSKFPELKAVIYIGNKELPGVYKYEEIMELGSTVDDDELYSVQRSINAHEVIDIQYTSGTTGFPKGAMLTHYNLLNNGDAIASRMNFTTADRLCIPVPLFHCFGYTLSIMACLSKGSTMVLVDHFNPLAVMNAIQRERCTAVHGVPTMFITMLEHPDFENYDFSSLRTGIMAGSVCPIKVMRAVVDRMNIKEITSVYGLTEASPGITQTSVYDSLEDRVTTVGYALPEIEVKIVDPATGCEVPRGVQGEVMARGYNVMKGYYKMPEETEKVIEPDGWLHTGDIGVMDERGYLTITGRLKDMIIRGGENISPREIEEYLYHHPYIKDVQVVGVPDEKYGEEIMAYVIPKEGHILTEEEVIEYAKAGLARFKVPKYVRFLDRFPMTASGKIQKYVLREMGAKDICSQNSYIR